MDINEAIDTMAENIVHLLCDDEFATSALAVRTKQARIVFHEYSLLEASLSNERLEHLSEHDDNHPKYNLYWATLTSLNNTVLATTMMKMRAYPHIMRVEFDVDNMIKVRSVMRGYNGASFKK